MKLRIKGNSIRLRVGRSEVETLGRMGHVEDCIAFGLIPAETLRYRLQSSDRDEIHAIFDNGCITVHVPHTIVSEWVGSDEVGLKGSQEVEDGDELKILIEKDFECLNREGERDESDNFPNPKSTAAC